MLFIIYLFASPVAWYISCDQELLVGWQVLPDLGLLSLAPLPCGAMVHQVVTCGHKLFRGQDTRLLELGLLLELSINVIFIFVALMGWISIFMEKFLHTHTKKKHNLIITL